VTLTIQTEEDTERQLTVAITVDEARVAKAMQEAARKLAREIEFPGFRKGKVPYQVLVRRIGEKELRAEAIDDIVPDVFAEALEEIHVQPYGQPTINDISLSPLVIKVTVPLQPVVKLPNYREWRKEVAPVTLADNAVDEAIEAMRRKDETKTVVERPAQEGDFVKVKGTGRIQPAEGEAEGESVFAEEDIELPLDPAQTFVGTPFVANLVGLSAGEEKAFTLAFPADFADDSLAGKTADFSLTVLEVQERTLPELTDEYARSKGQYEDLAGLREGLAKELWQAADATARGELVDDLIQSLTEEAEIHYPPAAVDEQIDDMIESMQQEIVDAGWNWESYLRVTTQNEEALRADMRDTAVQRLRHRLALRQFIADEAIVIGEDDYAAKLEERLSSYNGAQEEQLRTFYSDGRGRDLLHGEVLVEKVAQRIKAIYSGDAPELPGGDSAGVALEADEEE
jgi:trigger factor